MRLHKVYAGLWHKAHKLSYEVKAGETFRQAMVRVRESKKAGKLQDVFFIDGLTARQARKKERALHEALNGIYDCGGDFEHHEFLPKHWGQVYNVLVSLLGETIHYQPNAYAVTGDILVQRDNPWPVSRKLKKNYVA
jgi:hypothetical protein|tara:strand:+ start:431 stop:841 length:411 start_codon:yes stop_codon:yes gene_type:complete